MGRIEHTAVFGFGVQGSAQALNLRDSAWPVTVCLRPGGGHVEDAKKSGIPLALDLKQAASKAGIAAVLVNDSSQKSLYQETLEPNLPKHAALVFAHGFAIHYKKIIPRPDIDVILVAPLAHGATLRSDFLEGRGVPCLIAVAQDATGNAKTRALSYANAISRGGPFIDSSFTEEVETDLFAEQAVLCGGLPDLIRAAFDVLVEKGINPDIAYYSCLRELRPITWLMDEHGIAGMRERISDTAKYGAITRGPRVINENVKKELRSIFDEIKSGEFAREFDKNRDAKDQTEHFIEEVHRRWKSHGT